MCTASSCTHTCNCVQNTLWTIVIVHSHLSLLQNILIEHTQNGWIKCTWLSHYVSLKSKRKNSNDNNVTNYF